MPPYVNRNIYEINITDLVRNCNNNKNTKWYTKAFEILIDYYNYLKNYNINVNSKHINIIGQAFNCIINDLNRILIKTDIQNMDYNMNSHLNNGTSNIVVMAGEFIKKNHDVLNEIVEYWVKHRDIIIEETSNTSTNQESYSSDESLPEWGTGVDANKKDEKHNKPYHQKNLLDILIIIKENLMDILIIILKILIF